MDVSGQMIFFTAGEKEVRTWMIAQGRHGRGGRRRHPHRPGPGLHPRRNHDRRDLVRLGSEREVKAQHLVRQEPKDYVVKDDDILLIRFSV